MDFMAKVMIDEQDSDAVFFYQDESRQNLIATVFRDQVAGIIFHPRNPASRMPQRRLAACDIEQGSPLRRGDCPYELLIIDPYKTTQAVAFCPITRFIIGNSTRTLIASIERFIHCARP